MNALPALITNRVEGTTYNATDLNRVGEAMLYVAARLRSCGWDINVTPKTDWTRMDWPTEGEMARYIRQLEKLHRTLTLFKTTPAVPVVGGKKDWLTPQEANDIEKILIDVEDMVQRTRALYFYAGDVYAGEV